MPQLDPTWFASQVFWLVITFVAMYFILSRRALPPLQEIVARRKHTVASDIEQAQQLQAQAEKARQDYERMMADARSRAQALILESQAQDKARAEKALQDMNRQVERKLEEATRKITAKKQELLDALAPSVTELTSLIVRKLTQREPTGKS